MLHDPRGQNFLEIVIGIAAVFIVAAVVFAVARSTSAAFGRQQSKIDAIP